MTTETTMSTKIGPRGLLEPHPPNWKCQIARTLYFLLKQFTRRYWWRKSRCSRISWKKCGVVVGIKNKSWCRPCLPVSQTRARDLRLLPQPPPSRHHAPHQCLRSVATSPWCSWRRVIAVTTKTLINCHWWNLPRSSSRFRPIRRQPGRLKLRFCRRCWRNIDNEPLLLPPFRL